MIAVARWPVLLLLLTSALAGCSGLGGGWSGNDTWSGPPSYRPSGFYGPGWEQPYGYGGRHYDDDRFVPGGSRTLCDRRTQTCYKNGNIDASETRDQFGGKAGRRADNVRDQYGGDTFVRSRNVACDRGDRVCYKNGQPDRSETRDAFGKKAARNID